ncbi:MAG TPA: aldose epimerase family protein [Steroidobacteraceae bacterium]|jgi:aldose 1-epimerase|nr:aldose epimerase family protein [Steroidobacteraceae bacterium]
MMRSFGMLEDGRSVEAIALGDPEGLQLEVLTYGAILRRLSFPVRGVRRDLILHFDRLQDYERDRAYVGSLVGRFGNRIANARFDLDGRRHALTANEGANHLHGGALGFGKRVWRVLDISEKQGRRVVLGYRSPDGEEGYPGAVEATVELNVKPDALSIALSARSDAATPVNLTYHPYFNLAGDFNQPAIDQRLRIPAAHYLPVAAGLIPTGELAAVDGTTFDFRVSRRLRPPSQRHPQLALAGGYDHCWVLEPDADCACELSSRDLTLTMSGGPGLQFYNGQFLSRTHPALGSGVILEPQGYPNAPNESKFPSSILRPGETWRNDIEYRLLAT